MNKSFIRNEVVLLMYFVCHKNAIKADYININERYVNINERYVLKNLVRGQSDRFDTLDTLKAQLHGDWE